MRSTFSTVAVGPALLRTLAPALLLLACGSSRTRPAPPDAGPPEPQAEGGAQEAGPGDEPAAAEAPPPTLCPNVVIVQDKSRSMCAPPDEPSSSCCPYPPTAGCQSRWTLCESAVKPVVEAFQDRVRFGLVLFASDTTCGPGRFKVEPDYGTAGAIAAAYQAVGDLNMNGSWTPTAETFDPAATDPDTLAGSPALQDPGRPSYLVLLTDGAPNCTDPRDMGERAAIPIGQLARRSPAPLKTFVVGFGRTGAGDVNPCVLGKMAVAGGLPRSGCDVPPSSDCKLNPPDDAPASPCYYDALDAASLEKALMDILGGIGSTAGITCIR